MLTSATFFLKGRKMSKRTLIGVLISVMMACTCLTNPAIAVEIDHGQVIIADEIKALSIAVDNLTRQIIRQAGETKEDSTLRKLDIAIAYLNFRSRRIEMFERELQTTRAHRNRIEDVLEQFKREENNLSQSFTSNQQDELQRAREELRFRQQAINDRRDRMDEEIIMLENRIMDMQSQIDSIESFVQKNLEFYR
jgi:predicted  nucleic acid-binding Zn-ribbon protein